MGMLLYLKEFPNNPKEQRWCGVAVYFDDHHGEVVDANIMSSREELEKWFDDLGKP
jgi:hypothetical protein